MLLVQDFAHRRHDLNLLNRSIGQRTTAARQILQGGQRPFTSTIQKPFALIENRLFTAIQQFGGLGDGFAGISPQNDQTAGHQTPIQPAFLFGLAQGLLFLTAQLDFIFVDGTSHNLLR